MSKPNALLHVAVIPDGTRRWAQDHGKSLGEAYEQVAKVLVCLSNVAYRHGVRSLSIYTLSNNNLHRSAEDLEVTFASHIRIFREVLPDLVARWNAHVFHTGDVSCLPKEYVTAINDVCRNSYKTEGKKEIYICAGYSAEWELRNGSEAAHQAMSEVARPVPYDIDMLIRTGGEVRLSGFLPLQLQYAELFFLKKLFPDITEDDIEGAIGGYYSRERRFGR